MQENIFKNASTSYDYEAFLQFAANVIENNEAHPETITDEKYAHYTKLNFQRMKRWNKTFEPDNNLVEKIRSAAPQKWWVITEPWCGDSAQNLPAIAKIAAAANIPLRIVLRDDNPDIIDQYLTNGTKSIPILVSFDENGKQLFRWGSRPAAAQQLMNTWKADPEAKTFEDFELEMHTWYTADKGQSLQKELMEVATK